MNWSEFFLGLLPCIAYLIMMFGAYYAGCIVGQYRGIKEQKAAQLLVFVVMDSSGRVSAVTQQGKRIAYLTDTQTRTADITDEENTEDKTEPK